MTEEKSKLNSFESLGNVDILTPTREIFDEVIAIAEACGYEFDDTWHDELIYYEYGGINLHDRGEFNMMSPEGVNHSHPKWRRITLEELRTFRDTLPGVQPKAEIPVSEKALAILNTLDSWFV